MKLLALMYHRAVAGPHGNAEEHLEAHFSLLARKAACVVPGEALDPDRLNVCLTFDDAYYDFFAIVFPLLDKYGLCAQLAVSPGLVAEHSDLPRERRLKLSAGEAFAHPENGGLCTWQELQILADSGRVVFASHGRTHVRLDHARADLGEEIVASGSILRRRLAVPVESFVFPYGRFNLAARDLAAQHYRYLWRIGQASNQDWNGRLLYRVAADEMDSLSPLLGWDQRLKYRCGAVWNQARGV